MDLHLLAILGVITGLFATTFYRGDCDSKVFTAGIIFTLGLSYWFFKVIFLQTPVPITESIAIFSFLIGSSWPVVIYGIDMLKKGVI